MFNVQHVSNKVVKTTANVSQATIDTLPPNPVLNDSVITLHFAM